MRTSTAIEHRSAPGKPGRLTRVWRHRLWAPLNERQHWDRMIALANPLWSISEPRARVVRVIDETTDVCSVWLKPNSRFKGFRPGQHVLLDLEIDGARQSRCFSLSQAPRADGLLRLTIKRKSDGAVSTAAHALNPGQIVRLSQAQGDFAPRSATSRLLLISAGSGITPMLSLLHGFAAQATDRDIVLLHVCRSGADQIGAAELLELAARCPNLRVQVHMTETSGRIDADQIDALVGDWHEREALLCGPDGFMRGIEAMFDAAGRRDRLQVESFGRRGAPVDPDALDHLVSAEKATQVFTASAGQSLLDAAEAAGLQPRFGCRRGICRTCQCLKRSGTVVNTLTGQVSGPGEELIQLCISTPRSAVELAL